MVVINTVSFIHSFIQQATTEYLHCRNWPSRSWGAIWESPLNSRTHVLTPFHSPSQYPALLNTSLFKQSVAKTISHLSVPQRWPCWPWLQSSNDSEWTWGSRTQSHRGCRACALQPPSSQQRMCGQDRVSSLFLIPSRQCISMSVHFSTIYWLSGTLQMTDNHLHPLKFAVKMNTFWQISGISRERAWISLQHEMTTSVSFQHSVQTARHKTLPVILDCSTEVFVHGIFNWNKRKSISGIGNRAIFFCRGWRQVHVALNSARPNSQSPAWKNALGGALHPTLLPQPELPMSPAAARGRRAAGMSLQGGATRATCAPWQLNPPPGSQPPRVGLQCSGKHRDHRVQARGRWRAGHQFDVSST
jgi:hypothetical protein